MLYVPAKVLHEYELRRSAVLLLSCGPRTTQSEAVDKQYCYLFVVDDLNVLDERVRRREVVVQTLLDRVVEVVRHSRRADVLN